MNRLTFRERLVCYASAYMLASELFPSLSPVDLLGWPLVAFSSYFLFAWIVLFIKNDGGISW